MEFDDDVAKSLQKKKVIDAYKELFPKVNEHIIGQFYDFCTDPTKTDFNDYLYLSMVSNERELSTYEKKHLKRLTHRFSDYQEALKGVKTTSLQEFKEQNMEIKGAVDITPAQDSGAVEVPAEAS